MSSLISYFKVKVLSKFIGGLFSFPVKQKFEKISLYPFPLLFFPNKDYNLFTNIYNRRDEMRIGIPKEIKNNENRVAITPSWGSHFSKCRASSIYRKRSRH